MVPSNSSSNSSDTDHGATPAHVGVDLGGTTIARAYFAEDTVEPDRVVDHQLDSFASPGEWLDACLDSDPSLGSVPWVLGVPSPVREGQSVAETPNLPKAWTGTAITDALKDRDIEFHLENDANLAALGEHHFGPGRDVRNLVLLTLGTGIGGGIIVDDGILRGATGAAAEVGHLTLEPGGRLCGCGHTGCFEQYGSARGLEQTYESLAGEHRSAREIAKRANGDPLAREAMTQTGLYLGRGLAQIINLLEPGLVLFSGGLAGSLEHLRPHIRAGLDTHVFASRARSIPLKRADRDQPALMGTHALIASRGVKSA